jgi:hypothetical protein
LKQNLKSQKTKNGSITRQLAKQLLFTNEKQTKSIPSALVGSFIATFIGLESKAAIDNNLPAFGLLFRLESFFMEQNVMMETDPKEVQR